MHPTLKKLVPLSAVAALSLAQVGCYDWVAIRPSELPKLNSLSSQTVAAGNLQVTVMTIRTVRSPDGRLVEIRGAHDVQVRADGATVEFEHPVESSVADETLTVAGSNREDTRFALRTVDDVKVRQYSPGKTIALAAVLSLIPLVGLVGVMASH